MASTHGRPMGSIQAGHEELTKDDEQFLASEYFQQKVFEECKANYEETKEKIKMHLNKLQPNATTSNMENDASTASKSVD